jgi:hypothetical protein
MLRGEATNINFIVFGLTRPGLELTIYRIRGEHANHYATDAVCSFCMIFLCVFNIEDISQREAEDTCKSYDGHLVSINSEPEMKFILHLLTEQRGMLNGL